MHTEIDTGLNVKHALLLPSFNQNWNMLTDCGETLPYKSFVVLELFHADSQKW
jgi:hypothetical protein